LPASGSAKGRERKATPASLMIKAGPCRSTGAKA
jgi:hypothetical protein